MGTRPLSFIHIVDGDIRSVRTIDFVVLPIESLRFARS